jgi:predicted phosphodiesterase
MQVAALCDIHGNVPALTAVLAEVDALRVDAIVVGGDVASGPMPVEALDALRARAARFVRGNADRVLDVGDAADDELWVRARHWVAAQLGEEPLAFLAGLPLDLTLEVTGLGSVRFCHGAPYEAGPGAYWALLGPDVEFRRTAYDVEAAARAMAATGYPRAPDPATFLLRDPERPARMSALIEGLP